MENGIVKPMLRSLLISYVLSGLLLGALAFALYKLRLKEGQVNLMAVSYTHLGVIDNRIYHMDGTAVYVQNNMITIVNILMNQNLYSLFLRAVCPISFTAKESPYNPGDHRGFAA